MTEDPRCCGSGMCIIDEEGRCWCGQQWDGQKMCTPPLTALGRAAASPERGDGGTTHATPAVPAASSSPTSGG